MKKRFFSLLLVLAMVLSLLPVTTFAADIVDSGTCGDNVTWTLDSDGVLTISGTGAMADYDWNKTPWYSLRSSIKSVNITSGVTSIGEDAFHGDYSSLTSVTIPDSVTSIGLGAFWGCDGLTSVEIPNGVTSIGNDAFEDCDNLTSVTIPNSVTSIGSGAFCGCSLTSVTIPDSVTSIGGLAFASCNLTSVTIPRSVTSINYTPFAGCKKLQTIVVEAGNPNYCSVDDVLFNKNKTNLICCPAGKTGDYSIPDSVTNIVLEAFSGCSGLTSVTIPDSVKRIGIQAFFRCSGLTSVTIPDSVTYLAFEAFHDCSSLTSIKISDSLKNIDKWTFCGCSSLTSVTIPDSVTSIGESAFSSCSSLTSVAIPESVTSIGKWAFSGCSSLVTVTIGNSVKSIGEMAFRMCDSLKSVTIPDSVTSIGDEAFSDCSSLTDVYYEGTEQAWNQISIGSYNDELLNATIHFNSTGPSDPVNPTGPNDPSEDIQFRVPEDEWKFKNFMTFTVPLSSDDYRVLTRNMDKAQRKFYDKIIYSFQSGLCYGFAATSALISQGLLNLNGLGFDVSSLNEVDKNANSKSVLGYYYLEQYTSSAEDGVNSFMSMSVEDRLEAIRNMDRPFIFSFGMGVGAHAVLGYGIETGQWNYHGHSYDTRLLIYDSNRPSAKFDKEEVEKSYLYFNKGTDQWEIPNYYGYGASSEGDGYLKRAWDDYDAINEMDLVSGRSELAATLNIQDITAEAWEGWPAVKVGKYIINLVERERERKKDDDISVSFVEGFNLDEPNAPQTLNVSFKSFDSFSMEATKDAESLNVSLLLPEQCVIAQADKYGKVLLEKNGAVDITGITGNYSASITENNSSTDWDTVEVIGSKGTTVRLQPAESGVVVSGDNLNDLRVAVSGDDFAQETVLKTDQDSILVSEQSDHVVILEDRNHDGTYESEAENHIVFEDVKPGAYYYEPVLWAVNHVPQITNGTSETTFSPQWECLRCQIVTFLWRAMGCPEPTSTVNPFVDVKPSDYFYKAVLWAVEQEITNGMDATHFGPNLTCTRGQAVTFLWRAEGKPAPKAQRSAFTDVQNPNDYFYTPVLWAVENGITNGTDETHFSPNMICLREQIVTFLYRDLK